MNKFALFTICCLALAYGSAYEIVEDDNGQAFYLVPVEHRAKRDTTWDINKNGPGVRGTIGQQGTIFNDGTHRLDGSGSLSKNFHPNSATTVGGGLGYTHVPSGSTLNAIGQTTRGQGTDLGIQGNANLWRQGNSRLDAVGSYDRHYGGASGTGKPNYSGGVQFNHRF